MHNNGCQVSAPMHAVRVWEHKGACPNYSLASFMHAESGSITQYFVFCYHPYTMCTQQIPVGSKTVRLSHNIGN